MSEGQRKYAVQRPKGAKWETLSLVEDLAQGKREFQNAIALHGANPVRLIQVDFVSDEALADFDWRLIELHDPRKGDRPKPTLIAGSERATPKPAKKVKANGQTGGGSKTGRRSGVDGDEKVPVPVKTYVIAFVFGALALAIWALSDKT